MRRRALIAIVVAGALLLIGAPASGRTRSLPGTRVATKRTTQLAMVRRVFRVGPASRLLQPRSEVSSCAPTACSTFGTGRARWPVREDGSLVVDYRYNDMGRPAWAPSGAASRSAIRAGAAEWHRWNPSVNLRDAGQTYALPGAGDDSCTDGVNAIGWRSLSGGALGVTTICYDPQSMRIFDVDTAFNSSLRWDVLAAPHTTSRLYDLQSIATHELGHWLSLLDLYSSATRSLTMYGTALPGQLNKRTLGLGDVLGARAAYPCSCRPVSGITDD